MKTCIILACLCLQRAVAYSVPPEEWQRDIAGSNLIFSDREDFTEGFLPPIGNGFLSADGGVLLKDGCLKPSGESDDPYWYFSGCGRVNIAGVFNNGVGENRNIPHRASVPNPHSVYIKNADANLGLGYDIKRNLFYNKSSVTCLNNENIRANVTLVQYMHRLYHQLQVLELEYEYQGNNDSKCDIELQPVRYGAYDYDFTIDKLISTDTAYHLTVKRMEEPPLNSTMQPSPPTVVAQVFAKIPNVVSFNSENTMQTFIAVYKTTVEKSKDAVTSANILQKATSDFFSFVKMEPHALKQKHIEAWEEIFYSGIEIEGNSTIATTVNSSLSYILSAIRVDQPFGISPGGIARGSYNVSK